MASISTWTFTQSQLTSELNTSKEHFLEIMMKNEIITEEQKDEMNKYCFVVSEKGFFGKFWDKIIWKEKEA